MNFLLNWTASTILYHVLFCEPHVNISENENTDETGNDSMQTNETSPGVTSLGFLVTLTAVTFTQDLENSTSEGFVELQEQICDEVLHFTRNWHVFMLFLRSQRVSCRWT